ncbi:MAG: hypothetical protein U1E68_02955 [Sphingomonadaceae bacterium]|jgi:hypothetical protein
MSDLFDAKPGSFWVCFDLDDDEDVNKVHSKILSADFISSWWNHIPRLYILQSNLDRVEFYKAINVLFREQTYLMGVFEGQFGGRLSFEKWKNLLNATPETLRKLEIGSHLEAEKRIKKSADNAQKN